ncbi:CHD5-like protein-domain-containing protein [Lipomyces japonicus]|uniref:CHD5-like protein-domain-containing protein n=1 Tax=Lipomyces japonicus TaxID=56871 RepID=UPI0034CFEA7C
MVSVLVVVISIVILSAAVSTIGADNIGELLWEFYVKLVPSSAAQNVKTRHLLQREAIRTSTERSNTSSQDEFAKWAKLNRKVDKLKTDIEKINATIATQKTKFKRQIKTVIWIFTSGLKFFVRIKYRKVPVFWLPKGLFPGWIEWVLSLTSAPQGSVSVSAWFLITDYAIKGAVVFIVQKSFELAKKQPSRNRVSVATAKKSS